MDSKILESYVAKQYADEPILVDIARCESTFRQFDPNGNVMRGKANKGTWVSCRSMRSITRKMPPSSGITSIRPKGTWHSPSISTTSLDRIRGLLRPNVGLMRSWLGCNRKWLSETGKPSKWGLFCYLGFTGLIDTMSHNISFLLSK